MKKTFFALMAFLVLFSSSCRRNTNNGGSWTFKGRTYNAMGCDAFSGYGLNVISNGSLGAATSTTPDYSLTVVFGLLFLPHTSGTYTVIDTGTIGVNQLAIDLAFGFNSYTGATGTGYYHATGGNGHNQTVQVTVSNSGKISVSGSGIMMQNDTLASDSSILDFNITQLN